MLKVFMAGWREAGARGLPILMRRGLEWLPVAMLLPFGVLFLATVLPRMHVPWQLEWMEGHGAEQAWRFANGLPLYPGAEDGYVPYMYGPVYHALWGMLMSVSGQWTLGWGRLLSLMGSLGAMGALVMMVFDRTRRLAPSLVGALVFVAFFKATGYWYDIARVDALALGLTAWGLFLALKRDPKPWQAFLAILVLLAAVLTKQSAGPVAVFCGAVLLIRQPKATLAAGALSILILMNLLFVMGRTGNTGFIKYTVTNPMKHPVWTGVYFPGGTPHYEFFRVDGEESRTVWHHVRAYVAAWKEKGAPAFWREGLRHVWLLLAMVVGWLALAARERRIPRGAVYIVPAVLLSTMGVAKGYALFGGYINHLILMFFSVSLLSGFAFDGIRRHLRGRARNAAMGVMAGLLVLQLLQPWNLPAASDHWGNWSFWQREPNAELQGEVRELIDWRHARAMAWEERREFTVARPEVSLRARLELTYGRWASAGLLWKPSHQWPHPEARAVYTDFMDWLRGKAEAGEPVWVMHHHWYALRAGHPMAYNLDAVRCAAWMGDAPPERMLEELYEGRFTWLVIDQPVLEHDWQMHQTVSLIRNRYEETGRLPFLADYSPYSFLPVTGAPVAPNTVFRFRGHGSTGKEDPSVSDGQGLSGR